MAASITCTTSEPTNLEHFNHACCLPSHHPILSTLPPCNVRFDPDLRAMTHSFLWQSWTGDSLARALWSVLANKWRIVAPFQLGGSTVRGDLQCIFSSSDAIKCADVFTRRCTPYTLYSWQVPADLCSLICDVWFPVVAAMPQPAGIHAEDHIEYGISGTIALYSDMNTVIKFPHSAEEEDDILSTQPYCQREKEAYK